MPVEHVKEKTTVIEFHFVDFFIRELSRIITKVLRIAYMFINPSLPFLFDIKNCYA